MKFNVCLSSLSLLASVAAQSTVVPSAVATTRPPTARTFYTGNVFYSTTSTTTLHDSHTQSIVDVSDISSPAALWNSLEVRRPVGLGNSNPITTTNVTIQLNVVPTPGLSATNNFATNLGAGAVTVFTGAVNLPARANQATWPYAWETPIPFSTPFPYVALPVGSLVIDIYQTGNSATTAWYLEASTPDNGGRPGTYYQSNCRFSNGNPANGVSYSSIILPGSNWRPTFSNILPNAVGIGVIGAYGPGQTWGGIPLPLDLTPFGAPGCGLYCSMEIVVGLAASATGSAQWPNVAIPNDPSLAGSDFYDHSLWVDAPANALGIVTGYGGKWHIGTGIGAPGSFVYALGNSAANATGTLQVGTLPSFELNP